MGPRQKGNKEPEINMTRLNRTSGDNNLSPRRCRVPRGTAAGWGELNTRRRQGNTAVVEQNFSDLQ